MFSPLGVVMAWHYAVECLVSVSNCVIYIFPLLLNHKYDNIVGVMLRQFLRVNFFIGG